jgi:segregation and condensation protein B
MATPSDAPGPPDEPDDPLAAGRLAAAQLGGDWQLDIIEEPEQEDTGAVDRDQKSEAREEQPAPPSSLSSVLCPLPSEPDAASRTQELPPSPEQLVEAMLFVGGHPLAAAVACSAVRGLTPERFHTAIDALNKRYREQWRPYTIEARDDGFVLVVRPAFRNLRERLFGGPRETRLSQPALDVLSVVAYRQPVGKAEIDAIRGTDSGATLRQLIRLGLVAVLHRADAAGREVRYGTTPRFLQVFGLSSLDELPRLGDPSQV